MMSQARRAGGNGCNWRGDGGLTELSISSALLLDSIL
jgi:hypothetical protein